MDNKKNDRYYIEKSLNEINTLIKYTEGITEYEQTISDGETLDAVMFRLVQLIELIKNLSDVFKQSHPQVNWGDIVGFRNGIVHEYGETDYSIVYEIITRDIYDLKELFESCL